MGDVELLELKNLYILMEHFLFFKENKLWS